MDPTAQGGGWGGGWPLPNKGKRPSRSMVRQPADSSSPREGLRSNPSTVPGAREARPSSRASARGGRRASDEPPVRDPIPPLRDPIPLEDAEDLSDRPVPAPGTGWLRAGRGHAGVGDPVRGHAGDGLDGRG